MADCRVPTCKNGAITGEYFCPNHKQGISGAEFYDMALENARRWNHGALPAVHICEGFLFNALHYPDKEFPFSLPPVIMKNDGKTYRNGVAVE